MSDQTSIFNTNSQATPENTGAPSTAPNVQQDQAILTLLGEIKNERGEPKYKSLPDALNALKHSQEYIPQLTASLSQKDAELNTARAAAAKIEELERTLQSLTRQPETPAITPAAGMTAEQVAEIVSRTLTDSQKQAQAKANGNTVATALVGKFGTEAEKAFNAKAEELGFAPAELHALAAKSPKAVLAYFNVAAPSGVSAPVGSVNTSAMQPHQDTFIARPKSSVLLGATTQELNQEVHNARKMIEELDAQGMSINDLTNPKTYAKYFGR